MAQLGEPEWPGDGAPGGVTGGERRGDLNAPGAAPVRAALGVPLAGPLTPAPSRAGARCAFGPLSPIQGSVGLQSSREKHPLAASRGAAPGAGGGVSGSGRGWVSGDGDGGRRRGSLGGRYAWEP